MSRGLCPGTWPAVAFTREAPGGPWSWVLGIFLQLGDVPPGKGKEKDLDFIGQGPLKWGRRTLAGAKDDFLGYWKELLDLILCAFNLMLRKYIFVYHDECTISFVTGAI